MNRSDRSSVSAEPTLRDLVAAIGGLTALYTKYLDRAGIVTTREAYGHLAIYAAITDETNPPQAAILAYWASTLEDTTIMVRPEVVEAPAANERHRQARGLRSCMADNGDVGRELPSDNGFIPSCFLQCILDAMIAIGVGRPVDRDA